MAQSGRFSDRIATRSPGWMPSVFRPSDRARTVKPKSAEEIGFHAPPTFEIRKSGFPAAAARRKTSQRVRTWLLMVSPVRSPRLAGDSVRETLSCRAMAIALLLTTALALAGVLATSAQGFLVASAIHSAAPLAAHGGGGGPRLGPRRRVDDVPREPPPHGRPCGLRPAAGSFPCPRRYRTSTVVVRPSETVKG